MFRLSGKFSFQVEEFRQAKEFFPAVILSRHFHFAEHFLFRQGTLPVFAALPVFAVQYLLYPNEVRIKKVDL